MRHTIFPTIALLITLSYAQSASADVAVAAYEHRPAVQNALLTERLDTLLPRLMRETQIDMWLVIAREYNDDPVFLSLVPKPRFTARRTTMLVFFDRGDAGVEKLTVSRYPLGSMYEAAWEGGDLNAQWRRLAEVIAERDPKTIAVNSSDLWPVADGLSHSLYEKLAGALGPTLSARIASAEALTVRWMETRTPAEVEVWQRGVAIARQTIAKAFSSEVITPGRGSGNNWLQLTVDSRPEFIAHDIHEHTRSVFAKGCKNIIAISVCLAVSEVCHPPRLCHSRLLSS